MSGLSRRRVRDLLGAVLVSGLLVGCGDEPGLDTTSVEDYLVQSQQTTFGDLEVGAASCPKQALEDGMTLPCTLAVGDADVPYRVTLRDVRASEVRVDVALDGVVLLSEGIERFVVSILSQDFSSARVDCDSDVIVAEVGDTVECTVASGAQTRAVVVTVDDEEGTVSIA